MSTFLRFFAILIVLGIMVTSAYSQTAIQDSIFIREHYEKHEYQIPMRDGVKLFTAVYVPKDTTELHPILMERIPYGISPYGPEKYFRLFFNRFSNLWQKYVRRNYILAFQDVRGRFMSEGTFADVRPYIPQKKSKQDIDESTDAYDTIDWLIKNIPRNNERVGVKGISYDGFYATMASIDAHPAVKAISPQAPITQWMGGDDFNHNGAFLLPHAFDFLMKNGWPRPQPTMNDSRTFNHGTPDGYKFFLDLGALPNANKKFMHDSVAFWNEIMRHGMWDEYWEKRSVLPHLKNIKPATMVVGGWFDTENLYGSLQTYMGIERNNTDNKNILIMGPFSHNRWAANEEDSLGLIRFGHNLTKYYADSIEVPFFDYYLRDKRHPNFAEATIFLTGANEWRKLDSWPPKNIKPMNIYLSEGEKLIFDIPKGTISAYDEYTSDPRKPVPYTAENRHWYNRAFIVEDQRFAARRPDVLVYQTSPLTEPITIAGSIEVNLIGSTSGTDCDWIVKVIDVFPDTGLGLKSNYKLGGYQMLLRGDVLRAKFRNSLSKPEPVKPNQPTSFPFVLLDIFHQFKKGHSIMVQIQSTWFPMIDRNPGKFVDIYHAKDSDYQKTTQRVYHSSKHVSYLKVNVVNEKK